MWYALQKFKSREEGGYPGSQWLVDICVGKLKESLEICAQFWPFDADVSII